MRRSTAPIAGSCFVPIPLRDEAGNIIKWYGTNIDIEDRKRGEEALRATELSWRQIVDNIPGLVATMGAMGEVEFLNRQTLEYFGKTSEELKDWSLIGAVHPDDLPRDHRGPRGVDRNGADLRGRAPLPRAPMAFTAGSRFAGSRCGMRKARSLPGICS